MTERYTSILAELTKRRDALVAELAGLNAAIAAIMPLVASESPVAERKALAPTTSDSLVWMHHPIEQKVGNYSRISVRWAALWHLAEFANGPLRNAEVADAILAGGYHSGAGSFPNAVSAVLSGMRSKGELDGSPDVGYSLTDKGREIWQAIKKSERFRSVMAHSSSPSEQTLLSVQ